MISEMWNNNFNKGVTIFQICLMGTMVFGGILGDDILVLFSMSVCLFGYFEPTNNRYSLNHGKVTK